MPPNAAYDKVHKAECNASRNHAIFQGHATQEFLQTHAGSKYSKLKDKAGALDLNT